MSIFRSFFIVVTLLITAPLAHADAWDNLSYSEAEAVVEELKNNPFIFDYCDCCDHAGEYASRVHLLKVTEAQIVPCEWDQQYYSVKISYSVLAELKYSSKGPNTKKLKKYDGSEVNELIFMNYTWVFNPSTAKALPLFETISYSSYGERKEPCKKAFAYPTPEAVAKVSDDPEYAAWYRSKHTP